MNSICIELYGVSFIYIYILYIHIFNIYLIGIKGLTKRYEIKVVGIDRNENIDQRTKC